MWCGRWGTEVKTKGGPNFEFGPPTLGREPDGAQEAVLAGASQAEDAGEVTELSPGAGGDQMGEVGYIRNRSVGCQVHGHFLNELVHCRNSSWFWRLPSGLVSLTS